MLIQSSNSVQYMVSTEPIGIRVYGASDRGTRWDSFTGSLDAAYPQLAAISLKKPLAIFGFGVLEGPHPL